MHESTATYETLTGRHGADQLTLFPEVSPASHTVAQASDLERKMTATSGRKCLESFGRLPRVGLWAKTFAALLIGRKDWYSRRCALTWRLRGTRYRRSYFLLQVSTPPIAGTGFGLLPTPRRFHAEMEFEMKDTTHRRFRAGDLMNLSMLPTPVTTNWKGSVTPNAMQRKDGKMRDDNLANLPAMLGQYGQLNPPFVEEMMGFPIGWTELPPSEMP